jgi:phosphoglycerol transferase MdoB-like AlkP superfamily enzyme
MDIQDHFPIVIYMKKEQQSDQSIKRYIQKVAEITPNQYKPRVIYSVDGKNQKKISRLSSRLLSRLVERSSSLCSFWPFIKKVGE